VCGIAGVAWTADAEPASPDVVWRMTDVLSHRGPDDAAVYHSAAGRRLARGEPLPDGQAAAGKAGAALGFRRLAIIDLVTGLQPLSNEDETVWISFNGEIYNYQELRPDLEARGHRFRTNGDTETIVHLYEEYGHSASTGFAGCSRWPSGMRGDNGCFSLAIGSEKSRCFIGTTAHACFLAAS